MPGNLPASPIRRKGGLHRPAPAADIAAVNIETTFADPTGAR